MTNVALKNSARGYEFVVDGLDLSNVASGIELVVEDGSKPARLVVEMSFLRTLDVSVDAAVEIDSASAEALVRLGWTPPTR